MMIKSASTKWNLWPHAEYKVNILIPVKIATSLLILKRSSLTLLDIKLCMARIAKMFLFNNVNFLP